MEKIFPSKTGVDTAVIDGVYLHSSYDPLREAKRFVETLDLTPEKVVLFLGSCLGYIEDRINERYGEIKICRVFFSDYHFSRTIGNTKDSDRCWYPGKNETFARFLSRNISEEEFPRLRVVEWEPAFRGYPDRGAAILEETAQYCREMNGSLLTTKAFGKRWILNSLRNFLHTHNEMRMEKIIGPILIAASGFSLPAAIPDIRRFRKRFSLWALPSSLDFLLQEKILPDLVVLTDPGYYSSFHLHGLLRKFPAFSSRIPLLLPLTAAFPSGSGVFSFSFFNQGTWFENILLQNFSPIPDRVPQNGTVAGTAVEIALNKTEDRVFIAGLDLSCKDVFEHVRPHSLDRLIGPVCGRLNPEESFRFTNLILRNPITLGPGFRTSPSLKTYAGWFERKKNTWKNRVFRLNPSSVETGMMSLDTGVLEGHSRTVSRCIITPVKGPSEKEKKEIISRFISQHDLSEIVSPSFLELYL
jgi:hypothetical protein